MRKALVVGINYYEHQNGLFGCVDDSHAVKAILERHGDGRKNFDVEIRTGTGPTDTVLRADLKDDITELFSGDSEVALFYFAGHGDTEATGGYLLTSECQRVDEGLSLADVLVLANNSKAKNKIIILDSCNSGIAGTPPTNQPHALLSEGLTILTASTADQYATEDNGSGIFTNLLIDALSGSASNLVGEISPGSVYAHIDQSLGAWGQRPVFKTNVKTFISLRTVSPPIPLSDLHRLTEFFPNRGFHFPLNPTFEPELKGRDPGMPDPIPENVQKFKVLQKYNRVNLVIPDGVPNMWNAAMESKSCSLTVLGEHYQQLVAKKLI